MRLDGRLRDQRWFSVQYEGHWNSMTKRVGSADGARVARSRGLWPLVDGSAVARLALRR